MTFPRAARAGAVYSGGMGGPSIHWLLTGCGLDADTITGGPVRFHEISKRWWRDGWRAQRLLTTSGGAAMLRRMGCELPLTMLPASLVARRERWRATRLWSYLVTAMGSGATLRRLPAADVVVTVSDYFCDIVPALRLKRRGARWVAWIHHREQPPHERPGNRAVNTLTWRMQGWSFQRIARHADLACVLDTAAGDQVRDALLALGMPAERIVAMRNGIDRAAIDRVAEPAKRVDAVLVGVRANKGMHDILPVWREVLRLRPGTTLRLMGGMSGEAAMLDELRASGLEGSIEVLKPSGGYLPAEHYYTRIKEARLLFAPSHEEGWGIAVCEALACGLPVIGYDLPVYRRIYGDALIAVPCFDRDALARALVATLDDQERFARQVAAGRACAARYDWDCIAGDERRQLSAL